ncbi:MAG: autotransporter outer membrane beta-barrel domain-containing protein [Xanthobacteraceae bacterium]
MKLKQALLAGAAVLCFTQTAEAQQFNQFFAFGDSTTDTGWFVNGKLSPVPNAFDLFVASAVAAGGNAHFTGPGPGNAQILAGFFGLTANAANTPGGTNYAIGGAFDNGGPAAVGLGAYTNILSIDYGLPPNPAGVPSTTGQINNYLASVGGHANPNALYLISSGGNDVFIAEGLGLPTALATSYFLSEAQALTTSVVNLQAAGARYIIVGNEYVPPVLTPTGVTFGQILTGATWTDLAAAGVNFIPADTASVIAAVERNPTAFGITAPITSYACVPPAALTGTTGYGSMCAPTTTPNPNYGYLVSANALQTHLFMDGIHLTEAGQLIEADYYYNLLVAPSEISFLAESAIQTTFGMITGIQQQIDVSQRQRPNGWNGWVNGQLQYLQMNNSANGFPNDPGFPVSGTMGLDYRWQNGWLAGAALTVGHVTPTFSLGGSYTQDEVALNLYAGYRKGNWWGDVIGSVGFLGYSTSRLVPIGITVQPNDGSTNGSDLSLATEVGYDFHTGFLTHGPVVGMILQQARVNGFTETGSFTSLSFGDQTRNSEVSALGYRASSDWGIWHPFAQVVWDHEFDPLNRSVTASLTTIVAPSYSMPAVVLGRDWATATIGTEVRIDRAWTGLASFTAQVGQQNVTNYGGLVGLNYAFDAGTKGLVYKN